MRAGKEVLATFRREWKRTRRWTLPALAVALAFAVPSSGLMGALGQSKFGVFEPYDDTGGWKQGVWEFHGEQVKRCLLKSMRTNTVIRCNFDVDYR